MAPPRSFLKVLGPRTVRCLARSDCRCLLQLRISFCSFSASFARWSASSSSIEFLAGCIRPQQMSFADPTNHERLSSDWHRTTASPLRFVSCSACTRRVHAIDHAGIHPGVQMCAWRAGVKVGSSDPELQQLQAAYQPAVWMPEKVASMDSAWNLHVAASGGGPLDRTDEEVKKATQLFHATAVSVRTVSQCEVRAGTSHWEVWSRARVTSCDRRDRNKKCACTHTQQHM